MCIFYLLVSIINILFKYKSNYILERKYTVNKKIYYLIKQMKHLYLLVIVEMVCNGNG